MAKPPLISAKHSLCIICEGYEEEIYVPDVLQIYKMTKQPLTILLRILKLVIRTKKI